jgi:hypothetical protein
MAAPKSSASDSRVRIGNVTFDCAEVLTVAGFWSAALDRPLDPGASEWFASIGGRDPERTAPAWYFARVPEPKRTKNRVHLDLIAPEPDAIERLVSLGAVVVDAHEVPGGSHRWTVMQDPEGNEFCVADKSYTGPS